MASTETLNRQNPVQLGRPFETSPKAGFRTSTSPSTPTENSHPLPDIPRSSTTSPISNAPPPPPHQPPPPPPHQDLGKGQRRVSVSSVKSSIVERLKRKSLPPNGISPQDSPSSQQPNAGRKFSFELGSRAASASPISQTSHSKQEDATTKPENRASRVTLASNSSESQGSSSGERRSASQQFLGIPRSTLARPASSYTLNSEISSRGRASPRSGIEQGSPRAYARGVSASRRSPENRPTSYVHMLNNVPYSQQIAPSPQLENAQLRSSVGTSASLLKTRQTLEMYRANVKKTNDPAVQYEFAIFMVHLANDPSALGNEEDTPPAGNGANGSTSNRESRSELLREAKQILARLSDRSYPFAQYYLGDGYASGLFNKGKEDYDHAFPLFVAASKHGHAEAGYRAALCYEFGWGCRKDYAKAAQFHRQAASKNHPGAATRLGISCLRGEMGLVGKYREGVKWLKRAQESADFQYNTAPYELGLLHLAGFGDDIFKDEAYAAQLLTQSADLGHPEANMMMGEIYEHGRFGCPKDPALSVHFYNGAAQAGHPQAMMALCAWYMVGAEPVLDKDENEAYEWAKKAAETGFPKAEYAVGYFTEMGIGCRRDPLEANVWYVRAADNGDERARQRLAIIRAAASGEPERPMSVGQPKSKDLAASNKLKAKQSTLKLGADSSSQEQEQGKEKDKECIIM
ncbi:MAG: hypothetical protein M1822_005676 [Bathelium mastoideum]|nr:MAG: hypothetical protein M1822_005676 [Bathelium mastoideum]